MPILVSIYVDIAVSYVLNVLKQIERKHVRIHEALEVIAA